MSWSFSSSSRAAFFRAAGPAAVVADWPASSPLPELPSGKRAIWSSGVKAGVDFEALPVRKLFASGTSAAPRSSTAIEMAGQFGIRTRAGRTRRLPVFYDAETPVNRYPEGFGRSFRKAEQTHQNLAGDGWLWTLGQSLSRNDLHAVAVDLHWQERGAGAHDCFLHMGAPLRLNQQHDAATAARSADFAKSRRSTQATRPRHRFLHPLLRSIQRPVSVQEPQRLADSRHDRSRLARSSVSLHLLLSAA